MSEKLLSRASFRPVPKKLTFWHFWVSDEKLSSYDPLAQNKFNFQGSQKKEEEEEKRKPEQRKMKDKQQNSRQLFVL